jgi:putative ABC transport system permease protein
MTQTGYNQEQKMFDLERAIRDWRKSLHKIEAMEDGHIAELESHLRDELEERLHRGEKEEEAFEKAVTNIGAILEIGAEVYKSQTRSLSGRPPWKRPRFMPILFWSYTKITLRKLRMQKGFSLINIAGLAIGMAACILILIWVQDELSYDKFHKNAGQIYRINSEDTSGGKTFLQAGSPAPLGQAMVDELPEVQSFTRVQSGWTGWRLSRGENLFLEEYLAAVDPAFFQIFRFPFIQGDPETALSDRYSIVLTEGLARKMFGSEDPLGKIVQLNNTDMTVTGIIKNIPRNSHLHFTFAFPAVNMTRWRESKLEEWTYVQFATYVVLQKEANIADVEKKMMDIVKMHLPKIQGRVYLQPLKDIHLHSTGINTWMLAYPNKGNISYVYIFSLTALCILLLACINFMNLSTARYATRAKEVGMRKVVGARRSDLIRQFLGESILLTGLALFIAVFLVTLMLPTFSRLAGKELSLIQSGNWKILFGLLVIALATSLFSGSYPAVFLSSFQPVKVIKNIGQLGTRRGGALRKALVVLQFTFTIGLIICTAVIYLQLRFIQNKDLGYDTENIISFAAYNEYETNYEAAKSELLQNPNILAVCRGFPPPSGEWGTTEVEWEGRHPSIEVKISEGRCSYDYLKVFNLKLAEGRFFSPEFSGDNGNWVLNETAIAAMEMENPIGKWFSFQGRKGTIIGILKDFHGSSLHNPIAPVALQPGEGFFMFVRYRPGSPEDVTKLLSFLKTKWEKFVGTHIPFRYDFIDENIKNWYSTEQRIGEIFRYFTLLAVIIACLGLFGLASYMAERRTKEIGIRKVLGAGISGIALLLTKEFVKWVVAANIVAWPLAYIATKKWLQGFAYRIDLGWEIFVFSAVVALVIALGAVGYQALKTAAANPIKALRYE